MIHVAYHVKGVVHGDTQYHRRDTEHYQRHLILYICQTSQSYKPAPAYRHKDKGDVPDATEHVEQQQHYHHHCYRYRHHTVGLDLGGIANGYHRTACQAYPYPAVLCTRRVGTRLQPGQQLPVLLCLTTAVWRANHHKSPLHVRGEDITVMQLKAPRSRAFCETSSSCEPFRPKEVQRVIVPVTPVITLLIKRG